MSKRLYKKPTKSVDKMKERLLCNPKIKMIAFNFPSGTGVICSLKDILEEQVDQKYFLSEKATQGIIRASQMIKYREQSHQDSVKE